MGIFAQAFKVVYCWERKLDLDCRSAKRQPCHNTVGGHKSTAIPITIVSTADRQASPKTIDFVASRMLQFYKSTNNFTTKHLI